MKCGFEIIKAQIKRIINGRSQNTKKKKTGLLSFLFSTGEHILVLQVELGL